MRNTKLIYDNSIWTVMKVLQALLMEVLPYFNIPTFQFIFSV